MHLQFVNSLYTPGVAPFTAGDFCEGLEFLSVPQRRAVLFGMEQRLGCSEVIELTHAQVSKLQLTPLASAVVAECPRHIRLNYVFWCGLSCGLISPLIDLGRQVEAAFGGMSWADLSEAYSRMIWVDHAHDAENFLAHARKQGLL